MVLNQYSMGGDDWNSWNQAPASGEGVSKKQWRNTFTNLLLRWLEVGSLSLLCRQPPEGPDWVLLHVNDEKLCKLPTFVNGTQNCLEILQCYTVFTFPNFSPAFSTQYCLTILPHTLFNKIGTIKQQPLFFFFFQLSNLYILLSSLFIFVCFSLIYIERHDSFSIKDKSLSLLHLYQSCLTLWDPMDCSPPGSSVHGILQARKWKWVAILFSRGFSWPRDWNRIAGRFFTVWNTREVPLYLSLSFSIYP